MFARPFKLKNVCKTLQVQVDALPQAQAIPGPTPGPPDDGSISIRVTIHGLQVEQLLKQLR